MLVTSLSFGGGTYDDWKTTPPDGDDRPHVHVPTSLPQKPPRDTYATSGCRACNEWGHVGGVRCARCGGSGALPKGTPQ